MYCIQKQKDLAPADELRAVLLLSLYGIQNSILSAVKKSLFHPITEKEKIKKILVLRQGGLGDTVTAMPAFTAIKNAFPAADIHLLTHVELADRQGVDEVMPSDFFDAVYRYKSLHDKKLITNLRGEKYDLYIELPGYMASLAFELRSILLARRIGAKHIAGSRISCNTLFSRLQEKCFAFEQDTDRLLKIVSNDLLMADEDIGKAKAQSVEYWKSRTLFRKLLNGIDIQNPIALIIGAGRPQNMWPAASFETVARHFSAKGYKIVLLGGEKEKAVADKIANGDTIINTCGQLNAEENAALLKNSRMAISNDTGAMHLAYSVGIPLIAIFSARDYANKWFPPADSNSIVLRNTNVACAICFSNTCTDNICMTAISTEEAIAKAEILLEKF